MKRILLPLMVLVLLMSTVTPAFAGGVNGTGKGKNTSFQLHGNITAVNSTNRTITVQVAQGNSLVKPYVGQTLVINTSDTTRYLSKGGKITFADLKVGNWVSMNGKVKNGVWTAARITVAPGRNK